MKKPFLLFLLSIMTFCALLLVACAAPPVPQEEEEEPVAEEEAFRFLFVSDSQAAPETGDYSPFSNLLSQAMEIEPDIRFVLHGGDLTNEGADEREWQDFLVALKPIGDKPFYPTMGNHDIAEVVVADFALPQNGPRDMAGCFYSFSYENAHFIFLDSNYMGLHREEYLNWLRSDIVNTDKQWNVVIMHHPLYPAADMERDTMRAETQREIWCGMLEELGIDLVLCGHQHMYMRSKQLRSGAESADGIVYLMASSGGKAEYMGTKQDYIEVLRDDVNSFCLLSINESRLTVTAYDDSGTAIDAFVLTADGAVESIIPEEEAAEEEQSE